MKTQLTIPYPSYPDSYRVHIVAILLIFVSACSVFKEKSFFETDSLRRRKSSTEIRSDLHSQAQAIRVYSRTDSAEKAYETVIFPKGAFRYSPEEGFSGTAEGLLIRGRLKEGKQLRETALLSAQRSQSTQTKENLDDLARTRKLQKEKKSRNQRPLYLATGILLLLLISVLFVLRRAWKWN